MTDLFDDLDGDEIRKKANAAAIVVLDKAEESGVLVDHVHVAEFLVELTYALVERIGEENASWVFVPLGKSVVDMKALDRRRREDAAKLKAAVRAASKMSKEQKEALLYVDSTFEEQKKKLEKSRRAIGVTAGLTRTFTRTIAKELLRSGNLLLVDDTGRFPMYALSRIGVRVVKALKLQMHEELEKNGDEKT